MLQLNQPESELLLGILRNSLSDLRMTIADTDNYDWRQDMKRDEATIKELIGRLESALGQPAAR